MKQKDLLLKDLCNRLHCGVKIYLEDFPNATLVGVVNEGIILRCDKYEHVYDTPWNIEYVKPYLLPLSSMTEEQKKELKNEVCPDGTGYFNEESLICPATHIGDRIPFKFMSKIIDWLNKNHFDIYGLIPMGLAKDATGLNIY